MKKNALLFLLAFGFSIPLFAQSASLRLSLIPLANPAAEPAAVDKFNQTMNQALSWLPGEPGVQLVPADTLTELFDEAVTPDFPDQFEPFSLAHANLDLRLDALLFCHLERHAGRTVVAARVLEFPSGVVAAENELPVPADTLPAAEELLKPLLERFAARDSLIGHPFRDTEQGVVLLTGDLRQEGYRQACQDFFAALRMDESQRPLRVKILPKASLKSDGEDVCGFTRDLKAATGASWLFDLPAAGDGARVRFALPMVPLPQRPVTEWSLPVYPQIDELACAEIAADTLSARMINAALLEAPDHPLAAAPDDAWRNNPVLAFRAAFRAYPIAEGEDSPTAPATLNGCEALYRLAADGTASKPLKAWSLLHVGALQSLAGRNDEAIEALLQAETLFGPMANPAGLILSRRDLAAAYSELKEWPQARQTFNRLLNIPPDSLTQAYTLQKIAQLYEKEGRTGEAVQTYHRTAKMNLAIKRPYEAAMVYQRLGQIMRETGDLGRSVAYLDTFLTQAKAMASEPALARAYFQMGLTRLARGERETALDNFLKSGDYLEMLGDHSGLARADLNIGAIYWQLGDTLKARQRYFSVINQATSDGDSVMVLMSAVNLADIHLTQKNFSQAQAFFDRALTIAQQARDSREQAKITYAKGLAYLKEGRLRAGYARIKEAMALGGGSVNGDPEKEQAFLQKLSLLIGDIETLRGTPPPRY
jgi:tetratricopeptide (TPR) repeat protein